jgi:membrane-associated HD superfamily phosphohydrolase
MTKKSHVPQAVILTVVASLFLISYRFYDPEQEAEHYYRTKDIRLYYTLKIAVTILTVAAVINAKYVAVFLFNSKYVKSMASKTSAYVTRILFPKR